MTGRGKIVASKAVGADSRAKFEQVQRMNLERAKQFTKAYESSEESDDERRPNDDDVEANEIFQTVFRAYAGNAKDLQKTQHFLENVFQSSSATCLICIASVRRTDRIWSCEHCYCFVHLACVQRWANDSLAQKQMHHESEADGYYTNAGEYVPKKALVLRWHCPQCRQEYEKAAIPREYNCFCGKEPNPVPHPWQIPHTCGEICGRPLRPDCGHRCVLLCHPGPCPPCPQIVSKSCACGQSNLKTIRCSTRSWQCGRKCDRLLACGVHKCSMTCHDGGQCKPCAKKATKSCLCGKKKTERSCAEVSFQCGQLCGKLYDCQRHECERSCHAGPCGPCSRSRTCPCGKQSVSTGDCSEHIDSCGDTCLKRLDCGEHQCLDRCHKGDCSKCKAIVEKRCRCGLHSKEMPCSNTFTCETKCKQLRSCKMHLCNRKCCDGSTCPPCDKICDKPLACTKHKCRSLCHTGPCFPCTLKANLKCRCAGTVIEVPCGRARKTKPPKCHLPCRRPSKCHHKNLHTCHDADCPPCVKTCDLPNDTSGCGHRCPAKCHDAVLVKIVDKHFKPVGPWDVQPETIECRKLPHPRCQQQVQIACLGGHEVVPWPCWDAQMRSCGRPCGRLLNCCNHECTQLCHVVADLKASTANAAECGTCERQCAFERPTGCSHPCRRQCHSDPCGACAVLIKGPCHCGLIQKMFKCAELYKSGLTKEQLAAKKEEMLCCGNRCIKKYPCGHQCKENCHSGRCPNPDQCKKKVKVNCKCKNRKAEVSCDKLRLENFVLPCNEMCKDKCEEQRQIEREKRRLQQEQEEAKNRKELEEFERRYGSKKPKDRKQRPVEVKETRSWIKIGSLAGIILIPVIASVYYVIFVQ